MDNARCILVAALVSLVAGCSPHQGPTREVVIVARGMSFKLEPGTGEPNPDISLRAGERVRLVLKNEAPGLLHDFFIPQWNVAIEQLRAGEEGEVVFTVPNTTGRLDYHCRPHSAMMSGFVDVTR